MAWQRVRIEIPEDFSSEEKLSIGRSIIEFIQERAIEKNTGFNPDTGRNKKFPKYTKEYAAKKGSSATDVNLVLSADMFNAMDVLSVSKGAVTIGFENGTPENGKAEGNQLGTYGQKSPIPGKARPFLGIQKNDLERIISEYERSIGSKKDS